MKALIITYNRLHLPKRSKEGNYAGDDGKSWYPGGWGVGWTTHWMLLPKKPV